jgi:hypothetical protein
MEGRRLGDRACVRKAPHGVEKWAGMDGPRLAERPSGRKPFRFAFTVSEGLNGSLIFDGNNLHGFDFGEVRF